MIDIRFHIPRLATFSSMTSFPARNPNAEVLFSNNFRIQTQQLAIDTIIKRNIDNWFSKVNRTSDQVCGIISRCVTGRERPWTRREKLLLINWNAFYLHKGTAAELAGSKTVRGFETYDDDRKLGMSRDTGWSIHIEVQA